MYFDLREILQIPRLYTAYQRLVGAIRARQAFLDRWVQPRAGQRILDIGCGPGDLLEMLPPVHYAGIDPCRSYIERARKRWGERGRFECAEASGANLPDPCTYDVVLAVGVLHHIDDLEAGRLFRLAARALRPNGTLFTLDGCRAEGQSWGQSLMLRLDRGRHIRDREAYESLARRSFRSVTGAYEPGLMRIPYPLVILTCRRPEAPAE